MDKQELKIINSLIVKISDGDELALEQLFESVGTRMLSVALGILKDRQLAEDAVQESFIKIIRYAASFKKRDNGYGWICTIVRNESLNLLRHYGHKDANIDDFFNLSNFAEDQKVQSKLEIELALAQLDKQERYIIWLKYMCDMTVREIATQIKRPKSTVQFMLKKAEKRLGELLSKN